MSLARRLALVLVVGLPLGVTSQACGTDAVGVQSCRNIETARCNQAAACNISLTQPLHSGPDVAACVRYYNDACLHGLASGNDPGAPGVQKCIDAINTGDCVVVANPEKAPNDACAFLIPPAPPPVVEAGADAPDATSDATTSDAASE